MSNVGFVVHHTRDAAREIAAKTTAWLTEAGHEVRVPTPDAEAVGLTEFAADPATLTSDLDVVVSLGGDGTMLRAVDLVAAAGVPVLGVNVGQLGYLTEVEPSEIRDALERFFAGDYVVEERMMLAVRIQRASADGAVTETAALNEAVLEKTPLGHTVRLDVSIDGHFFTPYAADGLIIASPTGSTAYSFSARGPIVEPTHRSMLVTPVSPHMLFDRTLVLNPDTEVLVTVSGDRPAALAVDGRMLGELQPGDAVRCIGASYSARLVTFSPRDFHLILKAKFGLSDR
jgi:NAD+ kinase